MRYGTWILTAGMVLGLGICCQVVWGEVESSLDAVELDIKSEEYDTEPPPELAPESKKPLGLSPRQEEQVLDFVNKYMKDHAAQLAELKKRNPEAYQRTLLFYWPRVRQYRAMPKAVREAHVQNANLCLQIYRTAKRCQNAKADTERKKLKNQLKTLLTEKFDVEQKVREYRLTQLDKQLSRLKKELKGRADQRDKVIARQLAHWLKEDKKTSPPPQAKASPPTTAPTKAPTSAPATQPAK